MATGVTPGGYTAQWSSEGESPNKRSADDSVKAGVVRELVRAAKNSSIAGHPAAPVVATKEDPGVLEVLASKHGSDSDS